MKCQIRQGDCREVLRTLDANSIDSCVTDPPYELTAARPGGRSEATRGKVMGGLMGMKWDATGVAADPATWAEVLRVLKPGAYLLAFGGTRTYHRMVCAIEDAGFEIRDTIAWIFGSGFPKSHNGEWGGTALKPAHEPICLARKPLEGTVEQNWRKHGTGALNIDSCRIAGESTERMKSGGRNQFPHEDDSWEPKTVTVGSSLGRWPANLIHDGSDEVLAAFPQAPGAQAPVKGDEPSASTASTYGAYSRSASERCDREPSANRRYDEQGGTNFAMKPGARRIHAGSAARFFYVAKASRQDRNEGLSGFAERPLLWSSGEQSPGTFQAEGTHRASENNHPTVKPTELMRYLCRLVTPAGGVVLDPFMGSGSTGKGAVIEGLRFVGIEMDAAYIEIARARIRHATGPLFSEVT